MGKLLNYLGQSKILKRIADVLNVTDVKVNDASVVDNQGVAEITVPVKISDLPNDAGFITNAVNDLANYYLKTETYTQAEVNALIGAITTISFLVVQTLPQTGEANIIYLVPKNPAQTDNIYDEYIWVSNDWEKIGDTEIDLSNYYTKTESDARYSQTDEKVKIENIDDTTSHSIPLAKTYSTTTQTDTLEKSFGLSFINNPIGTASEDGKAYLAIGNNKASGTVNNYKGFLRVYDKNTYKVDVITDDLTANRGLKFPNKDGVLAIASDVDKKLDKTTNAGISTVSIGTYRWVDVATLTITQTYADFPIMFEVSGRGIDFTRICVRFKSVNGTDPDLNFFITDNNINFHIKKIDTSTWKIYYYSPVSYGNLALHRISGYGANNKITVTVNMTVLAETPTDITRVEYGGVSDVSKTSNGVIDTDKRPGTADMTKGDGRLTYYLATSSMTTGKPPYDAQIIHLPWDTTAGYDSQLAISYSGGTSTRMWIRGQSQGTWGDWLWVALYDVSTFTGNKILTSKGTSGLIAESNNTLPSGSGELALSSEKVDWESNGFLSAKNLNLFPYFYMSRTSNNITFTVNDDGSVTVSTTNAGANADYSFAIHARASVDNELILPNGDYIVSGSPSGSSSSKYYMSVSVVKNGSVVPLGYDYGSGATFTVDGDDNFTDSARLGFYITIKKNAVITTPITFYPMIRVADDSDDTFRPYAKTNKELTDDISGIPKKLQDVETGVYNLIQQPYYNPSGASNGITRTVNTDGSLTCTGTATANSYFAFRYYSDGWTLPAGVYKITGCPSDGSSSKYWLRVHKYNGTGSSVTTIATDYGNGATFSLTEDTVIQVQVCVYNGYAIPSGGITFRPNLVPIRNGWIDLVSNFSENVDYDFSDIYSEYLAEYVISYANSQTSANWTRSTNISIKRVQIDSSNFKTFTNYLKITDSSVAWIEPMLYARITYDNKIEINWSFIGGMSQYDTISVSCELYAKV